jgi:predicted nucleic acid-binding protein
MMFVLDTNILSAMMSLHPPPEVMAWVDGQDEELLFTTSITEAEILSGLAIMTKGRRRRDLETAAAAIFANEFEGRVLPFDTTATAAYADLFAARRRIGKPTAPMDLMIASIARSHGASVVTRDAGGFDGCGLTVINPWAASTSP